jgi:Uncharacterized conserved protein
MNIKGKNNDFELIICNNFKARLLGNMFKQRIENVLCFPRCNSIHTFFMKTPIDIVMLNKEKKVIYIANNLKPYKIVLPKKSVHYTLEFPIGENIYNLNDYLEI